jgi:2-polyprenyl-6-methoxyphenol hydroxylase-like FAD-dependent oxidoreductase
MDSITMNAPLPVLIVGAGPTGLLMACELARHGIAFRIIEKKPERSATSNAVWIQTLTLELLDHLGIIDAFIRLGHMCDAINLYTNGKSISTLSFSEIESIYPFVLTLAQSETERLLENHLQLMNSNVERRMELVAIEQHDAAIICQVKQQDGSIETINSHWVIACDGVNSTVRDRCDIFFEGEDLSEQFVVADATIDSYMAYNEMHFFFDEGTLFAAMPLKKNQYRILANLHLDHQRKLFTEREVIEMAQERAYGAYYVKSASWISPFWIHGKVVKNMRHGAIFFAGDAAHVHSPLGGQGMNAGLQDAYNLAWKLALVIQKKAKPSLLDSYQAERHPVVTTIVEQTDKFTKMAFFDPDFLKKIHHFTKQLALGKSTLLKKIMMQLTQLSTRYLLSPVIHYIAPINVRSPQAGEHAPDVMINASKRLYDYLRHPKHHILLFTGLKLTKNKLEKIHALQQWLNSSYPDLIQVSIIASEKYNDDKNLIIDEEGAIHKRYHIKQHATYILRPDNYIAYCSNDLDMEQIKTCFEWYLSYGVFDQP